MDFKNNRLSRYIIGSWHEMKKVAWPDRKTTTQLTIVVIAVSLAVAAFMGAVDYGLNLGIEKFIFKV